MSNWISFYNFTTLQREFLVFQPVHDTVLYIIQHITLYYMTLHNIISIHAISATYLFEEAGDSKSDRSERVEVRHAHLLSLVPA